MMGKINRPYSVDLCISRPLFARYYLTASDPKRTLGLREAEGRRAQIQAMKVAKPWSVLASALNRQLGWGAKWKSALASMA